MITETNPRGAGAKPQYGDQKHLNRRKASKKYYQKLKVSDEELDKRMTDYWNKVKKL